MASMPTVSVVLPAYNAASTLENSIGSILEQSYSDFELLVINDGSTDETVSKAAAFSDDRIRVIDRSENLGLIATLNEGLAAARGRFVARQDADDISRPDRLEKQVDVLESRPEIGVIGSDLELVQDDGNTAGRWSYPQSPSACRWQTLFKTPVAHSSVLARRDLLIDCGGYREAFHYAEDYDLWSRVVHQSDMASIPETLVRYSIGESGISRQRREDQEATHIRIASRNMADLLQRTVPESVVRILALRIDQHEDYADMKSVEQSAETLRLLYDTFASRYPTSSDNDWLSTDYVTRCIRLIRLLPVSQRIRGLKVVRRFAPDELRPALRLSRCFGLSDLRPRL